MYRGLKRLAKELRCAVVLLSQLSRKADAVRRELAGLLEQVLAR